MAKDGLNISTQAGEGGAPILNFSQLNNTLGMIYQRDLMTQKYLQNNYQKSSLRLEQAANGVRPADMEALQGYHAKFQEAGLMLQSPKIRNNPKERAKWQAAMDDSYLNFMSLSGRSKKLIGTFNTINQQMAVKGGVGYKSQDELQKLFDARESLNADQIEALHYDTPIPYMLPASTLPQKDWEETILGKRLTRTVSKDVMDQEGQLMGTVKQKQSYYENYDPQKKGDTPWSIANNTAVTAAAAPAVGKRYELDYETAMQNNPQGVQDEINKAGSILGDKFKQQPDGYMKYAMAREVNKAQPTLTDDGGIQYDKEYTRKKMLGEKLLLMNKSDQYARGRISLAHNLKEQGKDVAANINTDLMYAASQHPNQQFKIGSDGGKDVFKSGYDIVNAYQGAISSDNPSKVNAGVLSLKALQDPNQRQRLWESLFPDEPDELAKMGYTNSIMANDPYMMTNMIVAKINQKFGQNIKPEDVYNYAIPVYVKKAVTTDANGKLIVVTNPTFSNPRTRNYGQFHSDVSQQVTSKKKGQAQVQDENFMDMIMNNMEPSSTPIMPLP